MKCSNCNTEFSEGIYCPNCGKKHESVFNPSCEKKQEDSQNETPLKKIFYDSSEKSVAVLGNSYLQRFLSYGGFGKGFAVLSDKRLYFKGKALIRQGKGISAITSDQAVSIRDVTGTGYFKNISVLSLVLMIIFWTLDLIIPAVGGFTSGGAITFASIFTVLGLFFTFQYLRLKYYIFEICFAGGSIAFDMEWISKKEAEEFQKALHLLKDSLNDTKNAEAEKNTAQSPAALI